jgi:UDP-N-acetylmuramate--alanine ligase
MIRFEDIKQVYFIGIGGIGMSAVARYFISRGKKVAGYDRTPSALTRELEQTGMRIIYEDDPSLLPTDVDMVVYTPAIPKDNRILNQFREQGLELYKRSDVLQVISADGFNICVAGTHGKTTISTMTAHLLRHSGYGCNAFLGGISANYQSNFWSSDRRVNVIEADEYDRSFLKLSPDIAVISAMDADHLDIYGTAEEMENAFISFSGRIRPGGVLYSRAGLKREKDLTAPEHLTYGAGSQDADYQAAGISVGPGAYTYRVQGPGWKLDKVRLHMGGLHNVENSVAAIAIAHRLGIPDEKILEAVAAFRGVKRRFEFIVNETGRVYIDDYAHHPEELRSLISGARAMFPDRRCTVAFQPHLYTRTRDFVDGFAESLDLADQVLLLPVYPARELPIEGVESRMISQRMKGNCLLVDDGKQLLNWVTEHKPALLITAGAGDIDRLVDPISQILKTS